MLILSRYAMLILTKPRLYILDLLFTVFDKVNNRMNKYKGDEGFESACDMLLEFEKNKGMKIISIDYLDYHL